MRSTRRREQAERETVSAMSRGGDGDSGADQRRYRGQPAPENFGRAAEEQVAHHPTDDSADGA